MQIGVLGAGMVGRAIAIDLASTYNVTSFDISGHSLQLLTQKNNSIKTIKADLAITIITTRYWPVLILLFLQYRVLWAIKL